MKINLYREQIIKSGFINKTQIQKFLNIGFYDADTIYTIIRNRLIEEDYMLPKNKIPVKNFLKTMHIRESDIFKYARMEEQDEQDKEYSN